MVRPDSGWSARDRRTVRSWRGLAIGGLIALIVPVLIVVLSLLVNLGARSAEQVDMPWVTSALVSEVVIGPVGIIVAGWYAGARGMPGWVLLLITAVPLLAGCGSLPSGEDLALDCPRLKTVTTSKQVGPA